MGLSSEHAIGNELEIDWSQEQLLKDVSMEVPPQLQASQARNNQQQQQQQQQQRQQPFPPLKCPRCDSINTKFCYYNNYSRSQPRYLCKACKRHWTQGGTLRSVPVGGTRRNKRNKSSSSSSNTSTPSSSNKNPPVLNISQPFASLSENMLRIQSQVFPPHYFSSMIIPDAPAISPYVYSGQQQFLGPNINYAGPSSGVVANDGDASGGGGDIQLLGPSSDCWPSWENDIVNINLPYVPEDDL